MILGPRPNRGPLYALILIGGAYALLRFVGRGVLEVGLAVAFVVGAVVCVMDWWFANRSSERTRELAEEARTEDVLLMESFARMTPEQIQSLQETRVMWRHVYPAYGDARHVATFPASMNQPAEDFTLTEISAVMGVCTETSFPPLSTWSEGSRLRKCADAIYRYGLARNWLNPWAGPNPASWREGGYEHMRNALMWKGAK